MSSSNNLKASNGTPGTPLKISTAANGDTTLVTGVAGKTIKVMKIICVGDADVAIKFKDSTPTDHTGAMSTGAKGGGFVMPSDGEAWFTCAAGKDLIINLSGAVQVSGALVYVQE